MDGNYSEENIKTLEWKEHIRLRPGMYIGKLGDGSSLDDGIYVLLKEVMDNAVDEYMMGFGRRIDVSVVGLEVKVRDFGRGYRSGR
jgi:topoisomerase-4 subunit B